MPEEFRDSIDAGTGDAIPGAVDIGAVASSAPEPDRKPGKRRGRPPGSGKSATGTSKEKIKGQLDLSSLTGLFVGIHVIAANATGVPELVIDQAEADQVAKTAQNVARHYNVETTQKTLDWVSFIGCLGMVYGTRFGAYMLRKRAEQQAAQPSATIYQMPERGAQNVRPVTPPQPEQHVSVEMDFEAE